MNNVFRFLNEVGKEIAKQRIDTNPYTSDFQKATAKAWIDGYCDFYTYSNRVINYLFEYSIREYQYQTRCCYQQPIYF